jgi:hypothetical protein
MYPPVEMHEMSFWKLVQNSPEWVAIFTTVVFAIVTSFIIWRQYRVMQQQSKIMQRQAENSDLHERQQNRLIQLQHEHEWMERLNAERERLLSLAERMRLHSSGLILLTKTSFAEAKEASVADELNWRELRETASELDARLRVLNVAVYAGSYHAKWHQSLKDYVAAILKTIEDEFEFRRTFKLRTVGSSSKLAKALKEVEDLHNPMKICLDIEAAIRMEFVKFKQGWDIATAVREE